MSAWREALGTPLRENRALRFDLLVGVAMLLLIAGSVAGKAWFDYRLASLAFVSLSSRLDTLDRFVESRGQVAPADVLAEVRSMNTELTTWLHGHSTLCEECAVCQVCAQCVPTP